ncbi:MAG: type II toxin-antitoxin system VapC family toxin [Thermoanaerobaculia bacterium]
MNFLLDTCVISEVVSKRPNLSVLHWIDSVDPDRIHLSVVTIGEIQKGIEKLRDLGKKEALATWLKDDLLVRFRDRLAVLDLGTFLQWGNLIGRLETQGTPMPAMDSLIAATALHGHFVLVTRNEDDFLKAGVQIFNPWKSGTRV